MLLNYETITHKRSLNLGPHSNEASSDFNIQNRQQNKIFIFIYLFFSETVYLLRQRFLCQDKELLSRQPCHARGAVACSQAPVVPACAVLCCAPWCVVRAAGAVDHVPLAGSQPNYLGTRKISFLHSFGLCIQSQTFPLSIPKFWD